MRRRLPCFIVTAFLVATAGAQAQSPPGPVAQPPSRAANEERLAEVRASSEARASAYANPAVYAEQKAQWMARLQNFPDSVEVIEGAAQFFILRERGLSEQLFEEGRTREPDNPRWTSQLANLHKLNADSTGDLGEARLALTELERLRAMPATQKRGMPTELPQAAFAAGDFQKARTYAEQLLQEAVTQPTRWDYGNAVHTANLVLGRLAARQGRMADAVRLLRTAGETPGSPQLNSFGPNMSLAKDLLELGETEAVLAYFELCRVFWKMGGERLDAWALMVKEGKMPNFGANLVY
jgi:tetratricopeptide (TPR) repeat protein